MVDVIQFYSIHNKLVQLLKDVNLEWDEIKCVCGCFFSSRGFYGWL